MIGPVQKNKAKYVARHASLWHSCDDLPTAQAVARYVVNRRLPVLIQVNIDDVAGQRGVRATELSAFASELVKLDGLQFAGLMCMAGEGGDAGRAFRAMRGLRDALLNGSLADAAAFELCMGMSGDYQLAVAEGSTMVRLGSVLLADWDVRHRTL